MTDQELWDAVVEAQRELNRRQADFYQNAETKTEILRAALSEGGWPQTTALGYLTRMSGDDTELLPQLVLGTLDTADDRDYRRFAELLAHIEAWPLLEQLVRRARSSDDPDIREVAEDFSERYGPMWSR